MAFPAALHELRFCRDSIRYENRSPWDHLSGNVGQRVAGESVQWVCYAVAPQIANKCADVPDWHSALELVRSRGVPVVIGEDPQAFGPEASYVGIDERAAARRLGEHIVNLGHRDIAVVAHWIVDDGVTDAGARRPGRPALLRDR